MTETAGAGARAAAATTDTDHAALLMTAIADDRRVLESEFCFLCDLLVLTYFLQLYLIVSFSFLSSGLVDECMEEEEAGAARMTGTL